jgi:cellulose synthase/poly-beta-1,6-N-acetylglucosamine synthase-like glycosyltransferase
MIIAYCVYLIFILLFLFLIDRPKINAKKILEKATVIVCAHNEEKHLIDLLDSLFIQDTDLTNIQFLFVDDRSEDKTPELFAHYESKFPNCKIITITDIPEGKFGKKNALEHAIDYAENDILIFTDADCICSINWISSTLNMYDKDTASVVGNSPLKATKKSHIQHFQEAETFFSHIIAYVSIRLKSPVMSFGRNFSYRKSVFEKINGFEAISESMSGDDDLMLDQIRRHRLPVKYNPEAFVPSPPMVTFKDFIRQRTRHMSAVKYFSFSYKLMSALFHFSHLLSYFFIFYSSDWYMYISIKLLIDCELFRRMNRIYKSESMLRDFFLWELYYLAYVFTLAVKGYFTQMKSIKW